MTASTDWNMVAVLSKRLLLIGLVTFGLVSLVYFTEWGIAFHNLSTEVIVRSLYWTLGVCGTQVIRTGNTIMGPGYSGEIDGMCNGLFAIIIVVSVVAVTPLRWHVRAIAGLLGIGGCFILNLIRLVAIFWIGLCSPRLGYVTHEFIWPVLQFLLGAVVLLIWVNRTFDKSRTGLGLGRASAELPRGISQAPTSTST
jgi:exosortase/archaeosortase family protein